MKTEKNIDMEIDRYLLDKMTPKEKEEFEKKLAQNKELYEQVLLRRDILIALKLLHRKDIHNILRQKEENTKYTLLLKKHKWRFVIILLIVLALLIGVFFYSW